MISSIPYNPVQKAAVKAIGSAKSKIHSGAKRTKPHEQIQVIKDYEEPNSAKEFHESPEDLIAPLKKKIAKNPKYYACIKQMKEACWETREWGLTVEVSLAAAPPLFCNYH